MNAIIQQFQNELTLEERARFETTARHAGLRPGQHLKALLLAPRPASSKPPASRANREARQKPMSQ